MAKHLLLIQGLVDDHDDDCGVATAIRVLIGHPSCEATATRMLIGFHCTCVSLALPLLQPRTHEDADIRNECRNSRPTILIQDSLPESSFE